MADLPPRDEILQTRTPADLFGGDATDPLALRRAYAALVKAHRGDDEVFRHVRAMFEAAREQPGGSSPAPEAPGPEAAAPVDPTQGLREALRQRDPGAALALLRSHADPLIAEDTPLVGSALQFLVFGVGEHLALSAIELLSVVVERPDLELSPELVIELEQALATLRCLWASRADPQAPHALEELILRSWYQPPGVVAQVWLAFRRHVDESGLDLPDAMSYLEHHHPAVLGAVLRAELRMIEASTLPHPPPWDLEGLEDLQHELRPSSATGQQAEWIQGWAPHAALYFGLLALLWPFLPLLLAVLGAMAGRYLIQRVFTHSAQDRQGDRLLALDARPLDDLLQLAEAHGLWPRELARALAPHEPVPLSPDTYAYHASHPLVRLCQDPSAVVRCMGPRHLERFEGAGGG